MASVGKTDYWLGFPSHNVHPHTQAFIQICYEGHSIELEVERIFEIKKKKINKVLGFFRKPFWAAMSNGVFIAQGRITTLCISPTEFTWMTDFGDTGSGSSVCTAWSQWCLLHVVEENNRTQHFRGNIWVWPCVCIRGQAQGAILQAPHCLGTDDESCWRTWLFIPSMYIAIVCQ